MIDGYTQAGATTQPLAVGDNAVIMIQLDGTLAGTADAPGYLCRRQYGQGPVVYRFQPRTTLLPGLPST